MAWVSVSGRVEVKLLKYVSSRQRRTLLTV